MSRVACYAIGAILLSLTAAEAFVQREPWLACITLAAALVALLAPHVPPGENASAAVPPSAVRISGDDVVEADVVPISRIWQ